MSESNHTAVGPSTATGAGRLAGQTPIIVRHLGMRTVTLDEVVVAVGGLEALGAVPRDIVIDTRQYADDVEDGNWGPSHGEVWRQAQEVKKALADSASPRLIYAGALPEVPHAVAFGAYVEEFWPVEAYDFHDGVLRWIASEQTLNLGEPTGLPLDKMTAAGPAVLRVEISYRIEDEQVDEFVPEEQRVADVRISPQGKAPATGLVRSPADVEEVRRTVRTAIMTLIDRRPKLTTIHLFIAAPVSACVVAGQELRLRNHPRVQTYRHRRNPDGSSRTTEAILLAAGGPAVADIPLTEEQAARAGELRKQLWEPAIRDVERYADRKKDEADRARRSGQRERWYDGLPWWEQLQRVHPFPALPPVYDMVKRPATVDPMPFDREGFGFQREELLWRVNDGFSLRLAERFPDLDTARALVRIFLFHEYLHEVHGITKESYREVGKFPNGLERADYMCDLYGILHELDWEADENRTLKREFEPFKRRVSELIDLVIRSFWAFEDAAPLERMEVRRMRRYMNWYWQQVRVRHTDTLQQLAAVLARQPVVELAGLATSAEGRRYYASLRRLDRDVGLEMAIVLDNEILKRIKTGVTTPFDELTRAFRDQNHGAIQQIFRGIYSEAETTGHVLPREEDLP